MSLYYLDRFAFDRAERVVCEHGSMRVVTFRYSTGVCAIRTENTRGYFTVLPFNGHQIWRASFDGIDLWMKTAIEEPVQTQDFLTSYGCFMMHSGLCFVGIPGKTDTHRVHGDLPTAPFENARIECGEDEGGRYISIIGTYHHYASFSVNYLFTSRFKLYESGTLIHLGVTIENLRKKPMEYGYLCHINFRPFENARLVYSAPCDTEHIRVHKIIPPTMPDAEAKALRAYMDTMQKKPEVHTTVCKETQIYDPEIVSTIFYKGDENGMAHTLQCREDGYACYVTHPVEPLNNSLRWISRTPDEDAMGMVLPSTAEHLGYTHAKQQGQIRTLDGGEKLTFGISFGLLVPVETEKMCAKIEKILR